MNIDLDTIKSFVNHFICSYPNIKKYLNEPLNYKHFIKVISEYPGNLSELPNNFDFNVYEYQENNYMGGIEVELYFDGKKSDLTMKIDYQFCDNNTYRLKVYDLLVL